MKKYVMQSDINFLPKVASKLTEGYYVIDDFPFKIEKPIVSICILQYNNEDYVEELLESLIKSSKDIFTDKIEVVILNDCSPRSELLEKIINNFKSKYPKLNLRYYKNEKNLGQLESRRRILEYASGEYIKYIDGDDLLCENAIDNVINLIDESDRSDIIETNSYELLDNEIKKHQNNFHRIYDGKICDENNLLFKYLDSKYLFFTLWTKCCKKSVLMEAYKKIPIDTLCCLGEDLLTTFMIYSVAKTYYGNSETYAYIYRKNVGCSTLDFKYIDIKALKRNTNYITARLTYEYILSLKDFYSEEQYDKLVDDYRIKIFRQCLAFDYSTYSNIIYSENIEYRDGLDKNKVYKYFESLYGTDVWSSYIEIKKRSECRDWCIPYLVDWFGGKKITKMTSDKMLEIL